MPQALETDLALARHALAYAGGLFGIEREAAAAPPGVRGQTRRAESEGPVDASFDRREADGKQVLDRTPATNAIGYGRTPRVALQRFRDGRRLPLR